MATTNKLSLCMIVRDSSRTLEAALTSIAPWVDEMVVVDTGSQDNSREIAKRNGARVFDHPWCDSFADARNASLSHATGDWIFWMDSDDTIDQANGSTLRELANGSSAESPMGYVMQVHCPGQEKWDVTVVDHVKLFRNDSRLRFEGRIHEQILPAIRRCGGEVGWSDVFVVHSGSDQTDEGRKKKQRRDLRLLELEATERPNHPFVLFNIGMTYADMNRHEDACAALRRCLEVSHPEESHVRKAYSLLVGCLAQSQQTAEAYEYCRRGRQLYPLDAELAFREGVLAQHKKDYQRAIACYEEAILDRDERHFTSRDRAITGCKARHNLASVFGEMNRYDLAELQWRLVLDQEPQYRDGWRGLVDALLDQQKHATLEVEIESARERGMSSDEIACATAKLATRRGNTEFAIQVLDREISTGEGVVEPLRLKCQLLFENSMIDEAAISLEELCRHCPEDGAAWHNLGTAHQVAGRNGLAVICYQKSLGIRPGSHPTLTQLETARQALQQSKPARHASEIATDLDDNLSDSPLELASV